MRDARLVGMGFSLILFQNVTIAVNGKILLHMRNNVNILILKREECLYRFFTKADYFLVFESKGFLWSLCFLKGRCGYVYK